ncbi:cytochrome C assembly family protein [Melghirimyces algeriensis]|uniref:HemX family protein n=1 Tax=Melghirimyces algeriensis TaxID=910412 RepID=A0A521AQN2_9BACL|nr:cytochrome c biogenesis protein CcsA [Melghirimyces algeriensis]SMO37129.1 HemX family protein [Melghirimyces algeriensis]
MFAERWFYDLIMYIYALSLLFAFSDIMQSSRRARRLARFFLVTVWFFQTVFFTWRVSQFFPKLVGVDSLLFYSWALVTASLVIHYLYRMDFIVFAVNLLSFGFLATNLYITPKAGLSLTEPLLSELVFIHATLAFLAYALFSLSAVCAGFYLIGNYMLKQKKWNRMLRRLPSLGRLQLFSYHLNILGVPLLISAIILGLVWASEKMAGGFWYDPKILGSFIVLIFYCIYLYQRFVRGWNGQRLAWWSVISFFTIVLNYLISNAGMSFHQWL